MAHVVHEKDRLANFLSLMKTIKPKPTKNNLGEKYSKTHSLLTDLVLLVAEIYPELQTENRRYKKLPYDNAELQELYELLVHSFTLLHQLYREKSHFKYISGKEDAMLALSLIEIFTSNRPGANSLNASREMRSAYKKLLDHLESDSEILSSRLMSKIWWMSRSSGNRMIKKLEICGYLKKVGGNRKEGYQYKVKPFL